MNKTNKEMSYLEKKSYYKSVNEIDYACISNRIKNVKRFKIENILEQYNDEDMTPQQVKTAFNKLERKQLIGTKDGKMGDDAISVMVLYPNDLPVVYKNILGEGYIISKTEGYDGHDPFFIYANKN